MLAKSCTLREKPPANMIHSSTGCMDHRPGQSCGSITVKIQDFLFVFFVLLAQERA